MYMQKVTHSLTCFVSLVPRLPPRWEPARVVCYPCHLWPRVALDSVTNHNSARAQCFTSSQNHPWLVQSSSRLFTFTRQSIGLDAHSPKTTCIHTLRSILAEYKYPPHFSSRPCKQTNQPHTHELEYRAHCSTFVNYSSLLTSESRRSDGTLSCPPRSPGVFTRIYSKRATAPTRTLDRMREPRGKPDARGGYGGLSLDCELWVHSRK